MKGNEGKMITDLLKNNNLQFKPFANGTISKRKTDLFLRSLMSLRFRGYQVHQRLNCMTIKRHQERYCEPQFLMACLRMSILRKCIFSTWLENSCLEKLN